MGWPLCEGTPSTPCVGLSMTRVGEPDAGNLHVRFEEGERHIVAPYSTVNSRRRVPQRLPILHRSRE